MTGVVNQTGARSGIVGTNVGTPAGGATSGMISAVFRFNDTTSGTSTSTNSGTITVAQDANSFSAVSGRHYIISGSQAISPRNENSISMDDNIFQYMFLYYGTTDRSIGGTTLDTSLTGAATPVGRNLDSPTSNDCAGYIWWSYTANFTAGSTATHYVYTAYHGRSNVQAFVYNRADSPHNTMIYEVMP